MSQMTSQAGKRAVPPKHRSLIYLDNAATTWPKPPAVSAAVQQAFRQYGANPGRSGHHMAEETAKQVYLCREKAAALFHCQPEQVVFTQNCTHALNTALYGLIRRGDHVLISDLEHNAVARCVHQLWLDGVCTYSVVPTYRDDDETLQSFYRALRPNSRLICCTHGSNVFGNILPIQRLAAMAHDCGLLFVADCAQSGGVLELGLADSAIDFACLPGHKGLYGPSGTGLLLCNSAVPLRPLLQGGTGTESLSLEMPEALPERLESGTVNTMGIVGLSAGIDYVQGHSPARIYEFEFRLIRRLYEELQAVPWVHFYGEEPVFGRSLPLLSLTLGSMDGSQSADWLNRKGNIACRGGFHCAKLAHEKYGTDRLGTCRISPASFNRMAEIQQLCQLIRRRPID